MAKANSYYLERQPFNSPVYHDVVSGVGAYRGWVCVHVGASSLGFRHQDGRECCFNHPTIQPAHEQCWNDFTLMAHNPGA